MKRIAFDINAGEITCDNCEWLMWRSGMPRCHLLGGSLVSNNPEIWIPKRDKQCLKAENNALKEQK